MSGPTLYRLLDSTGEALDRLFKWHKLPRLLGVWALAGLRYRLRKRNLYDTSPATTQRPAPPEDGRYLIARTADGSFNDLENPEMGKAGTRFGRNVPIEHTHPDNDWAILRPNPRTVSRELLTRHEFQPVDGLNLLAASWLQFMVRDWMSHGKGKMDDSAWKLKREEDDDLPDEEVRVPRTPRDSDGPPPTYANQETHWWDASQIYGSNKEDQNRVRSEKDGKLHVGLEGLPSAGKTEKSPIDEPGFWIGLAMLHTLFAMEHNAICDRLRAEYPSWSDDDLFDHARLINAALLAKIHVTEWSTAILGHPTTKLALRTNWWGLATERIHKLLGRVSESEVISGIPGSKTDHFDVPYSITEEFVAVYRMHPLIPDDISFKSTSSEPPFEERSVPFTEVVNKKAVDLMKEIPQRDLFYSFGTSHPGQIRLHNFPKSLQQFRRPDGELMDLAATDIMRSRELGVPRYNEFRRLLRLPAPKTFEELTDEAAWAKELRRVYNDDIESVDLTIGMYAEPFPKGFGFSDTAFRIFILMASRRLNSDRFFTTDYTPRVYTQTGLDWIDDNDMSTVLLRHFPGLLPALRGVENAFFPWNETSRPGSSPRR